MVQSYRDEVVQRCRRLSMMQRCRGAHVQRCRCAEMQWCSGAEMHRCTCAEMRRCRDSFAWDADDGRCAEAWQRAEVEVQK